MRSSSSIFFRQRKRSVKSYRIQCRLCVHIDCVNTRACLLCVVPATPAAQAIQGTPSSVSPVASAASAAANAVNVQLVEVLQTQVSETREKHTALQHEYDHFRATQLQVEQYTPALPSLILPSTFYLLLSTLLFTPFSILSYASI